jgi:hypothetical protein
VHGEQWRTHHPEDTHIDYPEEEPPQLRPDELRAALERLRRKKSPGEDGIPNEALLQMPTSLASMLLALFTACMNFGYFPQRRKPARILLIPKSGKNKRDVTNYRPMHSSRLWGNVWRDWCYLSSKATFRTGTYFGQYGFRHRHSATHQLVRMVDFITTGFNPK